MAKATGSTSEKPTILFVHGAWDNGSAWDKVCDSLSKHGYPTVAPSLPSAGSRPPVPSHLEDAKVIRHELELLVHIQRKEVIVVGHSYGGFVAIESVKGFEKRQGQEGGVIHCLVMSAFVGCKGESVMSILDHKMPEFLELDPENPDYVVVRGAEMAFYNDVSPDIAASRLAAAAPHSYATFTSRIQDPCWSDPADRGEDHKDVPLTYLICANDQGIPKDLQHRMIAKTTKVGGAKWRVWECSAGHNPAMSQAETVSVAVRKVAGEDVGSVPDVEILEEPLGKEELGKET